MNRIIKENTALKFNLLKDQPITQEDLDEFGYTAIGESIVELVLSAEPPFTIGLYGQWGIGKSSICNIVKDKLQDNKDFQTFYFDTWKYERDSFRRQFLIELDEKGILKKKFNYKKILNQSLANPFNLSLLETFKLSLGGFLFNAICLILVIFVALLLFKQLLVPFLITEDYAALTQKIISLGIIGTILSFLLNSIKQFQGTRTVSRPDSAEIFEHHYENSIKELNSKKLLVTIDNLDRLEHGKAVDLLSDIKTFLASEKISNNTKNKVIFLIPCDDQALHNQIKSVYKENDAEEFLRKFFNVSFRIPKIINSQLDEFIGRKIKEIGIIEINNPNVKFVIGRAFKNNPREIIQYINSLAALFLVAKSRKVLRTIESENIGFLSKVLVIRVKWPKIYQYIEDRVLRTSDNFKDIIESVKNLENQDHEAFSAFMQSTPGIIPKSFGYTDEFFSLKQENFPEWNSFINYAEDNDIKGVTEVLETLRKSGQLGRLSGQLDSDYLAKNKGNSQKLLNVFTSISSALPNEGITQFTNFLKNALHHISDLDFKNIAQNISYDKFLNNKENQIDDALKNNLLSKMLFAMEQVAYQEKEDILENLGNFVLLIQHITSEVWANLEPLQQSHLIKIRAELLRKFDIRVLFPTSEIDSKQIDLTKLLLNPLSAISIADPFSTLYQLFFILQHSPIQENEATIKVFVDFTKDYVSKFSSTIRASDHTREDEIYRQFVSQVLAYHNSLPSGVIRKMLMDILAIIAEDPKAPQRQEILNAVAVFIDNGENIPAEILSTPNIINFLTNEKRIRDSLIQRSKTRPDLVKTEGLNLSYEENILILRDLANTNFSSFLDFLENVKYELPKEFETDPRFKTSIQERMISQIDNSDNQTVEKILTILLKMKIESDVVGPLYEALLRTKARGEEFLKVVKKFITKNPKVLGEAYNNNLK